MLLQLLLSLSDSPTNAKDALHYELPHHNRDDGSGTSEQGEGIDDDDLEGSDWTDPGEQHWWRCDLRWMCGGCDVCVCVF